MMALLQAGPVALDWFDLTLISLCVLVAGAATLVRCHLSGLGGCTVSTGDFKRCP